MPNPTDKRRQPAAEFDFEAELTKLLGPSGPARPEDFEPEGPGFLGRAINEMVPDFVSAGKTLVQTPIDMVRGLRQAAIDAGTNPRPWNVGPGGSLPLLIAQGLVGAGKDAITLLKSLGAGAEALAGGNPAVPQGVPEAGGRALGGIATGAIGKFLGPRIPGASRASSAILDRIGTRSPRMSGPVDESFLSLSNEAAPSLRGSPAMGPEMDSLSVLRAAQNPSAFMSEAEAIRMLLGEEGLDSGLGAAAKVNVPANLGFRPSPMGPGETVLRALLPERFQGPREMPVAGDVSLLDSRISSLPPSQVPFNPQRTPRISPEEASYQRVLANKGGRQRPEEVSRKRKFE